MGDATRGNSVRVKMRGQGTLTFPDGRRDERQYRDGKVMRINIAEKPTALAANVKNTKRKAAEISKSHAADAERAASSLLLLSNGINTHADAGISPPPKAAQHGLPFILN